MSRLRCFLTPRAWILSSRAENESLGGGLSRTFFAAMRLGEDLGCHSLIDLLQLRRILFARLWPQHPPFFQTCPATCAKPCAFTGRPAQSNSKSRLAPARKTRGCAPPSRDRKSTRLNSSHLGISYAV